MRTPGGNNVLGLNGKAKVVLPWAGVIWALTILWCAAGMWWDVKHLKERVETAIYTKEQIDLFRAQGDAEHSRLRAERVAEDNRIWDYLNLVDEVQAKPKRSR